MADQVKGWYIYIGHYHNMTATKLKSFNMSNIVKNIYLNIKQVAMEIVFEGHANQYPHLDFLSVWLYWFSVCQTYSACLLNLSIYYFYWPSTCTYVHVVFKGLIMLF